MTIDFTEEDVLFVKAEYDKFLSDYSHASFRMNCHAKSRLLIEGHKDGARFIAHEAVDRLKNSKPLAMIRIGEGEGNVLGFFRSEGCIELKWFNSIFYTMDCQVLPIAAAKRFAGELSRAVGKADIIGFRSFTPHPRYALDIFNAINRSSLRSALGMIRSLQYAKFAVEHCMFRNAVITSAWVHIGLLGHLDFLLENAPVVVVITGRPELEAFFCDKLDKRLSAFITIPVQASDDKSTDRHLHYPKRYNEIMEMLTTDLRGSLVLIGAGIFGKIYCAAAKRSGGVALDLGSAFDILAGKLTRPAHSDPAFFDLDDVPWIKEIIESR